MGNDDITTFDAVGQLKIIDVSCPQQLLSIMKWIMEGNRGLVYVRVMRTESAVLYPSDFEFSFGKGHTLREGNQEKAVIISSGRGTHESLAAAAILAERGIETGVVDMPSVDSELLMRLASSGKLPFVRGAKQWLFVAELPQSSLPEQSDCDSRNLEESSNDLYSRCRGQTAVHPLGNIRAIDRGLWADPRCHRKYCCKRCRLAAAVR